MRQSRPARCTIKPSSLEPRANALTGALDLAGVARIDRTTSTPRNGPTALDAPNCPLPEVTRGSRMNRHFGPRACNLLEQLKPFACDAKFRQCIRWYCRPAGLGLRPGRHRQGRRIYETQLARSASTCCIATVAGLPFTTDDVRRKLDQFRSVFR